MPGVDSLSLTNKKPMLRTENTGYMALAGLGLTTASAIIKNKSVRKYHKPFALITAGLTLLHFGIVVHNRIEWQKKQKEFIA